ncbi:outer membrane autotransporter protein [Phyllobacterium ifriqiyense]|uniref:Outer membrane autotransporter protein n=1 Tax=Phyllobacterium ifriqiyense TaxID=314238 RepID=A0ABU0SAI7_9HYPH|nr:outer membrane autotransporter protein [Phyllobacterium ifriqiyense]
MEGRKLASIAGIACFCLNPLAQADPAPVVSVVGKQGDNGQVGDDSHDDKEELGGTGGSGGVGGVGITILQSNDPTYNGNVIGGNGGIGGQGGKKHHIHTKEEVGHSGKHLEMRGGSGGYGGVGGLGIFVKRDELTFHGTATGGTGGKGGSGGEGMEVDGDAITSTAPTNDPSNIPGEKQYSSAEEHNGGDGGKGGDGGVGIYAKKLENNGTIIGGTGGLGGDAGYGNNGIGAHGQGGKGGIGASVADLLNKGKIQGGIGGSGAGKPKYGLGGNGGTGVLGRRDSIIVNDQDILGGIGGQGDSSMASGDGGAGMETMSGSQITNNGTIRGGDGDANTQGRGGIGVSLIGTLINNGTISGGDGGRIRSLVKTPDMPEAIRGTDSLGVNVGKGSGSTIINNGTITGGFGPDNQQGEAIQFSEKAEDGALILHAKSNIIGNVIAKKSISLKLGGTQAASFDVSKIGRAAQYRGFGAFSKIDSGTWTLEGETDAVMPWAVSGGTLAISSKRGLGDDKGQLNLDGGTLKTIKEMELTKSILLSDKGGTIENEKALTLSGPILQSGPFTKTGAGRLALLAKNTYKGETIVESGELNIAAGAAITSNTTVKRLGRLSVDGTAQDVTLDSGSRISGVGTIGDLTVKSGATVSPGNSVGTLHLGKDVTFNKSSIFDVEIKHDFSQADQLSVQGSAKLLGGVVDIRLENDLAVLTEDMGKSLLSKSYNILVAANGVTGQFDGVLSRYNYINPKLNYAATHVVLGFELAPTVKSAKTQDLEKQLAELEVESAGIAADADAKPLATPEAEASRFVAEEQLVQLEVKKQVLETELQKAKLETFLSADFLAAGVATSNQKNLWAGVQSLGMDNNRPLEEVLKSTIDNPLNFDALSGEVHATLSGVLAQDNHFISDAAASRLRNGFGGVAGKAQAVTTPLAYGSEGKAKQSNAFTAVEPAAATTAFWGEAYGAWAHADGNGNAAGYSRNTGGFITGMDGVIAEDWRLGLLAGYGSTSLHGNGKASVENYQLGVYGGAKLDALELRFGVNLGQHEIETKRSVAFGGLNEEHEASYEAGSVQVFGELGYQLDTPYAVLEPFAAARHVHVKTDGFGEDGAISNLTGAASSTDLTVTTLGLRASRQFALGESTTLTARGMLGWNHGFGDVTPQASLAFNGGQGFTVEGTGIAKDAALIEAGLDFSIGKATSIGVSYTGQFSSQSHDNAIKADLSVRF